MKTCLLVIDVQESFRHRPYFTGHDLPAYLAAQNALIAGCQARGVPAGVADVPPPKTADVAVRARPVFSDLRPCASARRFGRV